MAYLSLGAIAGVHGCLHGCRGGFATPATSEGRHGDNRQNAQGDGAAADKGAVAHGGVRHRMQGSDQKSGRVRVVVLVVSKGV